MDVPLIACVGLLVGIAALLLLDLFEIHRGAHEISVRDAARRPAGVIAISVIFGIVLGVVQGGDIAQQSSTGHLLENRSRSTTCPCGH